MQIKNDQNNNRDYLLCDLSNAKITGGKNDNKPINYNLQFIDTRCDPQKTTFISTDIIISVVSGYHLIFKTIYVLFSFLLFL